MSQQIENESEIQTILNYQKDLLKLGTELPKERLAWLAGYFSGQAEVNQKLADIFQNLGNGTEISLLTRPEKGPVKETPEKKQMETKKITLLYGSHSGNGSGFAKQAKEIAEQKGYLIKLINMADYKVRELKNEKNLLIIVSTHGEGVPPFAAEELYEYIHSEKAHKLADLQYSVLSLGDKSYFHFCKTGIDFDTRLEELGAKRIYKRVDCDLNFKLDAANWLAGSLQAFDAFYSGNNGLGTNGSTINQISSNGKLNYDEDNLFEAEILKKVNLNGRGSDKETYHIELSLEGSNITYNPGDAVAVKASNSDELVKKVLEAAFFTGNEKVQTKKGRIDLKEALKSDFELTVLSADSVRKHNGKSKNKDLGNIIANQELFKQFIEQNDVLDLLHNYPYEYKAYEFIEILRPLNVRLYSIASSQKVYEDELHIAVGAVRYKSNGRKKEGCCSTLFADRLGEGDKVSIYIKPNGAFSLPENYEVPVIMIGAGTGIAPYRAFVDERAANEAKGKNWLIFGNPHFTTDFLYQTEWQAHLKSGALSRMDVAFSRDQEEKMYVQHKITQNSKEVYNWLKNNAYVYVCGDKNYMAADVYKAFIEVLKKEAAMSEEDALEYLKNLKKKGQYLEDVY